MTIIIDPDVPASQLRQGLYEGDIVLLTTLRSVQDLAEYTREQLVDIFRPYDPDCAHEHFDKVDMARILGSWKPQFIHAERSRELVRCVIREAGFGEDRTHFDVPKPRTSFPVGHLTTGIAYAFPWHRDVWYSAPSQQINWWLPVMNVRRDNAMRFDVAKFDRPVHNTSDRFDYYEINTARLTTATQVEGESQTRPSAPGHAPTSDLVVVPPTGAVMLFSGAHLHASIPNTSGSARFSVDFRTVDAPALRARHGAPLVDVSCTGTSIRDFRRASDGTAFDEGLVRELFGEPPDGSTLVFAPPGRELLGTT
jgi:hypothetical protein